MTEKGAGGGGEGRESGAELLNTASWRWGGGGGRERGRRGGGGGSDLAKGRRLPVPNIPRDEWENQSTRGEQN